MTGDRRPQIAGSSQEPRVARGSKQRPLSPAAAPAVAGLLPVLRGAPDKRGPERLEGRGTRMGGLGCPHARSARSRPRPPVGGALPLPRIDGREA